MQLARFNTPLVANTGLAVGGVSICATSWGFFKVLADPTELLGLYEAAMTHTDPTHSVAKIVGAAVLVLGSVVVSYLACYLGKPSTGV